MRNRFEFEGRVVSVESRVVGPLDAQVRHVVRVEEDGSSEVLDVLVWSRGRVAEVGELVRGVGAVRGAAWKGEAGVVTAVFEVRSPMEFERCG